MKKDSNFPIQRCKNITNQFYDDPIGSIFREPVKFKEYTRIIQKPMDYSQIKSKLENNQYKNLSEWVDDFHLIYNNAVKFNQGDKDSEYICGIAQYFLKKFDKIVSDLQKTLSSSRYIQEINSLHARYLEILSQAPKDEYPTQQVSIDKIGPGFEESAHLYLTQQLNTYSTPQNALELYQLVGEYQGKVKAEGKVYKLELESFSQETISKLWDWVHKQEANEKKM